MKRDLIAQLHDAFERSAHSDEEVEFWLGSDLQKLLGYASTESFSAVIDRAKLACEKAGTQTADHFLPRGNAASLADDSPDDVRLTRYACYLIAQNGDPRKEAVAFAQTYFAVQTRKAEVIAERLKDLRRLDARQTLSQNERRLAAIAFEHGVDGPGFARIKSKGDEALFGGLSTHEMKRKLHVPESEPLGDFLPIVSMTAKAFADALTEEKIVAKNIRGEVSIKAEHEASNQAVRNAMLKRGVTPERLAANTRGNNLQSKRSPAKARAKIKSAGASPRLHQK